MEALIAPIFNFTVVVFVLFYYGRKPIADSLVTRRKTIETDMAEADRLAAEAQRSLTEWEQKWKSAEAHAKETRTQAETTLARFRETTLQHGKTEAARLKQEAQLVRQSEQTKAQQELRRELAHRSVQVAGRYLNGHMEEKDRRKLVSEYLEIVRNGDAR